MKTQILKVIFVLSGICILSPFTYAGKGGSQCSTDITETRQVQSSDSVLRAILSPLTSNYAEFSEFSEASRILVLGDGFSKRHSNHAEAFQKSLPSSVEIYKSGIECSNELDHTQSGNLHYLKIDHRELLPFPDRFFDVIVMTYGLCFCRENLPCCGGVSFESMKKDSFFSEVARVFNPNRPKAMVFLHGPHGVNPKCRGAEERALRMMSEEVSQLERTYPTLNFEIIFSQVSKVITGESLGEYPFQGILIRPKD